MTAATKDTPVISTPPLAQACAITFQGNASNNLQQDAFYLLGDWYQQEEGITDVMPVTTPFCLAVSDGVANSRHSQHCSKALVKAIKALWQDEQKLTADNLNQRLTQTAHPTKRHGAAATLAMVVGELGGAGTITATITHVGDSRVYLLAKDSLAWQCLTRDHNVLNELIDEQVRAQGRVAQFAEYNREGMAGSLYSITECFALSADSDYLSAEAPASTVRTIEIGAGDCLLLCTDGIHDLLSSENWQLIDAQTDLEGWLEHLTAQVYASEGNAYDNGTAIVVRFV